MQIIIAKYSSKNRILKKNQFDKRQERRGKKKMEDVS